MVRVTGVRWHLYNAVNLSLAESSSLTKRELVGMAATILFEAVQGAPYKQLSLWVGITDLSLDDDGYVTSDGPNLFMEAWLNNEDPKEYSAHCHRGGA